MLRPSSNYPSKGTDLPNNAIGRRVTVQCDARRMTEQASVMERYFSGWYHRNIDLSRPTMVVSLRSGQGRKCRTDHRFRERLCEVIVHSLTLLHCKANIMQPSEITWSLRESDVNV